MSNNNCCSVNICPGYSFGIRYVVVLGCCKSARLGVRNVTRVGAANQKLQRLPLAAYITWQRQHHLALEGRQGQQGCQRDQILLEAQWAYLILWDVLVVARGMGVRMVGGISNDLHPLLTVSAVLRRVVLCRFSVSYRWHVRSPQLEDGWSTTL